MIENRPEPVNTNFRIPLSAFRPVTPTAPAAKLTARLCQRDKFRWHVRCFSLRATARPVTGPEQFSKSLEQNEFQHTEVTVCCFPC